jgi:indole-3-glycerol phosphate synthase
MGADAVLLIAACLSREEARHLAATAHALDMEVLLEIHREDEIDYILPDTDIIGINNRDLVTFTTDPLHSARLVRALPPGIPRVAESGISAPGTVIALRAAGFDGFLVGEALMKNLEPGEALRHFLQRLVP